MSFIWKFILSILVIVVLYILFTFMMPKESDLMAKKLWIENFNEYIRNLKEWADWVSDELLQLKSSEEIIWKAKNVVNSTNEAIDKTKDAITNKIEQTNKVIKSWEKVIEATSEFKNNIKELSTLSWSDTSTGN
ncbi:MAG: hypothetical protein ACD_4C00329G0002 [uncultured bacterium (gcode 4)]|uniref:Uncharacterized protein n=1 Tax=uncultured bacterium (gcode 4) TaxID=1234023 RepID=K2G892_9BACT|nr:MAG: hypothetical protein ACD_4C00329G0002 [uncultured bacterium (gcode 4)]